VTHIRADYNLCEVQGIEEVVEPDSTGGRQR